MMCGPAKEWMVSAWAGDLDRASELKLREHLECCDSCRLEMAELSGLWERLGDLPVPEPSLALHHRWHATLNAVAGNLPPRNTGWKFSLASLWPNRPVWQATIAAACLIAGLLIGARWQTSPNEIARLREEVARTKELVTLSLLREQSATDRLRGVDFTTRMPAMDHVVVDALVQAVNRDANVNVRLAAIDALSRISGNAAVRQSMVSSLTTQDSPMVQAALIDYLVDARDRQALPAIQQFAGRSDLDPSVRKRAQTALGQLVNYR